MADEKLESPGPTGSDEREADSPASAPDAEQGKPRRILVVADETVVDYVLPEEIRKRAREGDDVLVVFPALNSRLRHWVSDDDKARAEAERRRELSLKRFEEAGVRVHGEIGDADPVQAIDDAIRAYGADEVVIAPRRRRPTHWLEKNITKRVRKLRHLPRTDIQE